MKRHSTSISDIYDCGIVGLGPAGIGAAFGIANMIKNTICFERGTFRDGTECMVMKENECCKSDNCSIISGIGGASAENSGKLSNYPAGSGLLDFFESEKQLKMSLDQTIDFFAGQIPLKLFSVDLNTRKSAENYYKERGIKYKYYDVYEFDGNEYNKFINSCIHKLQNKGLVICDNTRVVGIVRDDVADIYDITAIRGSKICFFRVRRLIIATGALSIEDKALSSIVDVSNDNVEIGLRFEAPNEVFVRALSTHGDLKLKYNSCRTYCVTRGGRLVTYRTEGLNFLEGATDSNLNSGYTNFAVIAKCANTNEIRQVLNNYRYNFGGRPIKQRLVDYLADSETSGSIETTCNIANAGNINNLFSDGINLLIKEFISRVLIDSMSISCKSIEGIVLIAPELKILHCINLDKNYSAKKNLYIVGAATGRFRGILQSFCSGIRCGKAIGECE